MTKEGKECQAWSADNRPDGEGNSPANFQDGAAGHDSNFCRTPLDDTSGDPAWCYTDNGSEDWGYCDIPVCGELTYYGKSLN